MSKVLRGESFPSRDRAGRELNLNLKIEGVNASNLNLMSNLPMVGVNVDGPARAHDVLSMVSSFSETLATDS